MALRKMTFAIDDGTATRLAQAAERLHIPKSQVVRRAILDFGDRIGKVSEQERRERLRLFDQKIELVARREASEVEAELEQVRRARAHGDPG